MSLPRRSPDLRLRAAPLAPSVASLLSMVLAVLIIVPAQPAHAQAPEELATQAEEAGFQAIDGGRWCDAAEQFLIAYRHVPNSLLLDNAAKAAAEAGDFALAIDIYRKLLNEKDKTLTRQQIRKELKRLGRRLADSEPAACGFTLKEKLKPPPVVEPDPQPTPTSTGAGGDDPTGTDPEPTDSPKTQETAPDEVMEANTDGSGGSPLGWVIPTAGAAGLITGLITGVIGGSALLFGLQPYMKFYETSDAIDAAERARDRETATRLQQEIVVYEDQWNNQGVYFAAVGGTALAFGVLVAVAGSGALAAGLLMPPGAE